MILYYSTSSYSILYYDVTFYYTNNQEPEGAASCSGSQAAANFASATRAASLVTPL